MPKDIDLKQLLAKTDLSDGTSIERYALNLRGMTFQDVLDLDIAPEGAHEKDYADKKFKGGMGNLIEERFFGYRANSDDRPDFPEAGVELKATCYDVKKDGDLSAGERLVLTMIPYDRPITIDFYSSHLWAKCRSILLVVYERDKAKDKYQQQVKYVSLFTPPSEDLEIIKADYEKIATYVQEGRADELSEGLTTYLGAATKGSTAEKSWVEQYYPRRKDDGTEEHAKAKRRAFSFKRQYMDYVLHHYLMNEVDDSEAILGKTGLGDRTFEERIQDLIAPYIGKSDRELCETLDVPYTGNKSQYPSLAYRMLGIKGNHAQEFIKAGISVRAVRIERTGRMKESLSFPPFDFKKLLEEDWDTSKLREELESKRFFFVVFRAEADGLYHLAGSLFWAADGKLIENDAFRCWDRTRKVIADGVELSIKPLKNDKFKVVNNLPGQAEGIFHVRPHTNKRAYRFADGTEIGNIAVDASELPDGRWMTKQSFWITNSYLKQLFAQAFGWDDAS